MSKRLEGPEDLSVNIWELPHVSSIVFYAFAPRASSMRGQIVVPLKYAFIQSGVRRLGQAYPVPHHGDLMYYVRRCPAHVAVHHGKWCAFIDIEEGAHSPVLDGGTAVTFLVPPQFTCVVHYGAYQSVVHVCICVVIQSINGKIFTGYWSKSPTGGFTQRGERSSIVERVGDIKTQVPVWGNYVKGVEPSLKTNCVSGSDALLKCIICVLSVLIPSFHRVDQLFNTSNCVCKSSGDSESKTISSAYSKMLSRVSPPPPPPPPPLYTHHSLVHWFLVSNR